MDAGLISAYLLMGMLFLLAIGMPLAFASGMLAVAVMAMKFGVGMLFSHFGMGPLNILAQRIYGVLTNYALISVPLFIFMALMLERSGIAKDMYSSLNMWLSRTRGGIAIVTSIMAIVMAAMSGIIGGEVVLLGLIALPQMLRLGYNQSLAIGTICASGSLGTMIPPVNRSHHVWTGHGNIDPFPVQGSLLPRLPDGWFLHHLYHHPNPP